MPNNNEIKETLRRHFSAAIIVRDSEKTIARALKSLSGIVGQIVVVDTGSIDSTPSICARMGAEVYYFNWVDDFSLARNYGLQFIRNEWCLILDSDEVLDQDTFLANLELFDNPQIGAVKVILRNYLDDSGLAGLTEHRYPRIFRSDKEYKFIGRIHEQISESVALSGLDIVQSEIIIKHYGYIANDIAKAERNKQLLMQELEHNPQDDWLKYHLAETYFASHDIKSAKKIFISIMSSLQLAEEQRQKIRLRLSQIALQEESFEALEAYLNFVSYDKHLEGMRKYLLGTSFLLQKRYEEAEILFNSVEVQTSNMIDRNTLSTCFEVIKMIRNNTNSNENI